jgi:DNA-binding MarR family transcriptional regulator
VTMPRRRQTADKLKEPDPVLQFLQMVWQLEHALERASKRMEDALGISGPQRFALRMIGVHPGITAGELASVLHLHPSTVTGIVQRLETRRLVKRASNADDGRVAHLYLTPSVRGLDASGCRALTVQGAGHFNSTIIARPLPLISSSV